MVPDSYKIEEYKQEKTKVFIATYSKVVIS